MASGSASVAAGPSAAKPSFAKIAAAGFKSPPPPSNTAQTQSSNFQNTTSGSSTNVTLPSSQPAGAPTNPNIDPSTQQQIQNAANDTRQTVGESANGSQDQTQKANGAPQGQAPDGLLMPVTSDEGGTQVSSSNSSLKPQSLDGKSTTSGATFGLDEKESLRPDDSASVKAIEDEDVFSAPPSGPPGSHLDADIGISAFRDQLREIHSMEPQRHDIHPPNFGNAPKGVLYVPPQGPGIGSVPGIARNIPLQAANVEMLPDPKLLEALENPRDRVWVLKLEQDVIDFVKDASESSLNLPQCNSFYRMLAHKMADYYMLGHVVDDSSAVRLFKTPNCRIPPGLTGIMTPSTAASTPPPSAPQMKILRRGDPHGLGNGSGLANNALENGESGNEDDKKPKPVSREEREARYEAARLRIMGSAKPSESPEVPKENQDSRSSSVTGKKNKKKARADSDDDFEARSAYSHYFAGARTDGIATMHYDLAPEANQISTVAYTPKGLNGGFQPLPGQEMNGSWAQQPYNRVDPSQGWAQGQPGTYDLAADFQRSLSFQNPARQAQAPVGFGNAYQQYYPQQQQPAWPQQPQFGRGGPTPPTQYGANVGFVPSPIQSHDPQQGYAFGQLPSQAFPGRPPNKLEHPLPGSYKRGNFNPQSQSFVPGHSNGANMRPFTPQGPPPNPAGFGSPYAPALQRQNSAQSQGAGHASPHLNMSPGGTNRPQSRQVPHSLPQRVIPRQTSPGLPLPPKPRTMPPKQGLDHFQPHPAVPTPTQPLPGLANQSVIAMYGAPSSLPAKPPPSSEPFDASKITPIKRPSFANNPAIAARQPSGGFPGPVGQPSSGPVVNGSGGNVKHP